jgi:hypothetical protein
MSQHPFRAALFASIGAIALAACQEAAPPASAPESEPVVAEGEPATETISLLPKMVCGADGFIRQDATRDSLAEIHGAENLVEEVLPWVDSTETALVLFPDDPAMRAEMFWLDKTSGAPRYVSARGAESQWIGPGGLFVGASLADVEAANGGPFALMGFQNHNAGEVVNWLGGALAAKPGDTCEFAMVMGLSPNTASELKIPVSGSPERVYRSDSPEMRDANPSVDVLALQFFDPLLIRPSHPSRDLPRLRAGPLPSPRRRIRVRGRLPA